MGKELFKILNSSSLFDGLTHEQIDSLIDSKTVHVTVYKRNDILFWTDKPPEKLCILMDGNIAMAKDTAGGKRSLSKSITTPGEITGEVRLFSPRKLLWEYAVALEDTTVLEVASKIFLEPDWITPEIQAILLRNIIGNIVEKIDSLGQKVRVISIPSARGRIAFYLLSIQDEQRRIFLKGTREEIADYLDMARPSLSRELGRMQDDGIIRIEGREVHIIDQARFDDLLE